MSCYQLNKLKVHLFLLVEYNFILEFNSMTNDTLLNIFTHFVSFFRAVDIHHKLKIDILFKIETSHLQRKVRAKCLCWRVFTFP